MSITMPKVLFDPVELKGGWDTSSPTLSIPPGIIRASQNFECAPLGGYSRIGGYERYDGHTSPSSATYQLVQVVAFTNTPTVGQTLTGNSSGATGTIVALGSNYMVLTQVVGTFTTIEVVKVGATTIGTATTLTAMPSAQLGAQYTAGAADVYRALISKPTGSGAIRGVVGLTVSGVDQLYAFRDNAGGTACNLWKATTSGWTQVAMKNEISFTAGGTATPADGVTLTQGGVTATVRRVMASSGSWAGSTAAGRLIIDNPGGGNFAAGAATLTGGIAVTLSGIQTAITILPGGKYEFAKGNFSGQLGTLRLYGADGVNRMFEFDGTTYAPIVTGVSPDTPKHLAVHKNYLFCSVQSSIFFCGVGTPFRWSSTDGGGEIATGDTVTGFLVQPGSQTTGTLAVYGRSNTFMLYGTSVTTWNFVAFNTGTGGLDYTAQNLSQSYVLDDRGVSTLATSIAYGNFTQATVTNGVKSFINNIRSLTSCSSISREKSQYRLFFTDGSALWITVVNGKLIGLAPMFFPIYANVAYTGELSNGTEVQYFGGSDGYVYQMDVGSSFDGATLDAYFTLSWNNARSPRMLKRWRHASIEMQGNFYASLQFGYQLGYATTEIDQPNPVSYASAFSGAPAWDTLVWDSFTWDGVTISPTEVDITGTAENIQVTISSTTNYIMPFTVNSIIFHYSPRRGLRS